MSERPRTRRFGLAQLIGKLSGPRDDGSTSIAHLASFYQKLFDFDSNISPELEMAGARYWGDERTEDAVYAVYLRKLRYVAPVPQAFRSVDPDGAGSSSDSDHLQWETVRERVVKAGTLPRLVDALFLPDGTADARQLNVFFATFRAFADAFDVLRTLLGLYDAALTGTRQAAHQSPAWRAAIKDSIRVVLGFWLESYPEDFREPPRFPCLTELLELAKLHSPHLKDLIPKAARTKAALAEGPRQNGLNGLGTLLDASLGLGKGGALESLDFIVSPTRVKTPDVAKMEPAHVAEQLTYWDAELFRRLIPWQCQARFWGRRKRGRREAERVRSVTATVELFNAVLHRLQTSLLHPPGAAAARRALILSKWIAVARELRSLKNFSSLRAVLSGLQSEPVHRLKATWARVPGEDRADFEELARVFGGSQDEDAESGGARRVLEKEATGKAAALDNFLTSSQNSGGSPQVPGPGRRLHRRAKSDMGAGDHVGGGGGGGGGGSVPYLGSFLTDLTFIDEAFPDTVPAEPDSPGSARLVNFEKRRKEFEVLAQLKLFQSAARQYALRPDPAFAAWFAALPCLAEKDAYARSLEIEPPATAATATPEAQRKPTPKGKFLTVAFDRDRKRNSLSRLITGMWSDSSGATGGSSEAEDSWFAVVPPAHIPHLPRSQTAPMIPMGQLPFANGRPPPINGLSGSPGGFYDRSEFDPAELFPDVARGHSRLSSNASSNGAATATRAPRSASSHSRNSTPRQAPSTSRESSSASESAEATGLILAISLHPALQPTQSAAATVLAKCLRLVNGERLSELVAKALDKHLLDGFEAKDFCLAQLKEDGSELILPDGCNPFYAVVRGPSGSRVQLQLRRKGAVANGKHPDRLKKSESSTLGLGKKGKRSNLFRWNSGFL